MVDGFVTELLDVDAALSPQVLEEVLAEDAILEEYRAYQYDRFLNRLNPYTTIRHALFLRDQENPGSVRM